MTKIIHFPGEINGSFRVHYLDKKPRNLNFMFHSKPLRLCNFFYFIQVLYILFHC